MADITSPQAIKFCNEKARIMADLIEQMDRTAQQFMLDIQADYEAVTQGNANEDSIIDGALQDGRPQLIHYNIGALKYACEKILDRITTMELRGLVGAVSVNGQPKF